MEAVKEAEEEKADENVETYLVLLNQSLLDFSSTDMLV